MRKKRAWGVRWVWYRMGQAQHGPSGSEHGSRDPELRGCGTLGKASAPGLILTAFAHGRPGSHLQLRSRFPPPSSKLPVVQPVSGSGACVSLTPRPAASQETCLLLPPPPLCLGVRSRKLPPGCCAVHGHVPDHTPHSNYHWSPILPTSSQVPLQTPQIARDHGGPGSASVPHQACPSGSLRADAKAKAGDTLQPPSVLRTARVPLKPLTPALLPATHLFASLETLAGFLP